MIINMTEYLAEWQSEDSDRDIINNRVIFWLPTMMNVHTQMWPFLNLVEMDAADFGYRVNIKKLTTKAFREIEK